MTATHDGRCRGSILYLVQSLRNTHGVYISRLHSRTHALTPTCDLFTKTPESVILSYRTAALVMAISNFRLVASLLVHVSCHCSTSPCACAVHITPPSYSVATKEQGGKEASDGQREERGTSKSREPPDCMQHAACKESAKLHQCSFFAAPNKPVPRCIKPP